MEKLVNFLLIIIVAIIGLSLFIIYENMPGENQRLFTNITSPKVEIPNISEVKQFYPNIRFNHDNLTYLITQDCSAERQERVLEAFSTISEGTKIITFTPVSENPDITISCSEQEMQKEKNIFVAGEGGPQEFINSTIYPVILRGKIFLYKQSSCKRPIVELHELLHVFGFDHINDSKSIMYPYAECDQVLKQEYLDSLIKIYSIPPLAELVFDEANVSRAGKYLNFDVSISNKGIIDAENVAIIVYEDNQEVKRFPLQEIKLGSGKKFMVENLKLESKSSEQIKLIIDYEGYEYDKQNNELVTSIQ